MYRFFFKRILDLFLSLIILIFFSPIIMFIYFYLLIMIGSPIFYHDRPGQNNKIITIHDLSERLKKFNCSNNSSITNNFVIAR